MIIQKQLQFIMMVACLHITTFLYSSNSVVSAFQELEYVQPTVFIDLQFPYNFINTLYTSSTITASGTVTSSNNVAVIASGAATSSSAILNSYNTLPYKSGQGCSATFSAVFTTGVAGNRQIIGVGNTTTAGANQDGFFFGYDPTTADFGIMSRRNGTDTWVDQTSWNGDTLNGSGASGVTLVPTNGNVYKIQYQWLGFGVIKFYVEKSVDGSWILVHTIRYPNSTKVTSLLNASLQLWAESTNTTNSTNITLQTSSMSGIVEGLSNYYTATRNAAYGGGAVTGSSSWLSIQNNNIYNSAQNQVMVYVDFLAVMHTGSALFEVRLVTTTVTGVTFTNIGANSVVSYYNATSSASMTQGRNWIGLLMDATMPYAVFDLRPYGIQLAPGDGLSVLIPGVTTSDTIYTGLSWIEVF